MVARSSQSTWGSGEVCSQEAVCMFVGGSEGITMYLGNRSGGRFDNFQTVGDFVKIGGYFSRGAVVGRWRERYDLHLTTGS